MIGYKAFDNKKMISMNNIQFELNKLMHTDGIIKAGPIDGNGFHFCVNFEDTFRFVPFNTDVILCEIEAFCNISDEYCDEYNGYYGIYSSSDMKINRIISREEIIKMACLLPQYRLERFIQTYKLKIDELKIIKKTIINNYNLDRNIEYYQLSNTKIFDIN